MQKVEYGDHLKNYFFFKNIPSVEEFIAQFSWHLTLNNFEAHFTVNTKLTVATKTIESNCKLLKNYLLDA